MAKIPTSEEGGQRLGANLEERGRRFGADLEEGLGLDPGLGSSLRPGLDLGLRSGLGLRLDHNGARRSRPSSWYWPQRSSPISATILAWVC
nr:hypothetical protein CFP56_33992 [Quercus suber]